MSRYRAPYDGLVAGVTVAVVVLLSVIVLVLAIAFAATSDPGAHLIVIASGLLVVAIPVVSYAYAPNAYRIEGRILVIERPAGPRLISLDDLVSVEPFDRKRAGFTLRTWGNGGLFGAYGRFWSRKLGRFEVYARRGNDYVMLRTTSRTIPSGSWPS